MCLLITKCPHCHRDAVSMQSVAVTPRSSAEATGYFGCPICEKPIGGWLRRQPGSRYESHQLQGHGSSLGQMLWNAEILWPAVSDTEAPEDVPPSIARNFIQAEEAAQREHWETAGMGYRRTLELTMKEKLPSGRGTLEKRINDLASAGGLTSDVANWAHSIRVLGNEAAHDEDEPKEEEVNDLGAFTRVMLEYLYTMPAKVARRANPPSSPNS